MFPPPTVHRPTEPERPGRSIFTAYCLLPTVYYFFMPCYDLHSHSTASDGTLLPAALVQRAAEHGVDVLALTDHDDIAGLADASKAASEVGIQLVPGVEVSVNWNGMVLHVVGLQVDPLNATLKDGLHGLRLQREQRAVAIAASLDKAGISGALEGAQALASGGIITRTHFAHFLVARGLAKDVRAVFKRYLVRGKPGFVAGVWAPLETAVGWINGAGGQAVLAHPARYRMTGTRLNRFLDEFKACGGAGIEVVCGTHSADETRVMGQRAIRMGLLASVGSDFHGPESPWVELGRLAPLPAGVTPIWKDW